MAPRMGGVSPLKPGSMFMVVFIAIAGIYLWGQFTEPGTGICSASDVEKDRNNCAVLGLGAVYETIDFIIPADADLESITFTLMKLLIIGVAVFVGYSVVLRTTTNRLMSKRDIMGLIILGVVVFLVWEFIIGPNGFDLLNVDSFADLTYKSAQKLGLV